MHVSKNKYVTDSISNLRIIERSVRSDETILLAIGERTHGHVIEHAINPQIKQARARDMSLGVFVAYNGGVRA